MRRIFVISVVLGLAFCAGCGKSDKKQISVSEEGILNVTETDSLLAPSRDESLELTVADNRLSVPVTVEVPAPVVEKVAAAEIPQDKPDNKGIQQALKDLGFYQGQIDGDLGPKSKAAIRAFQSKNGLTEDGKVGPKTWAVLREALQAGTSASQEN